MSPDVTFSLPKGAVLKVIDSILYTDFYQLTMAQVYFERGMHETPAQFDHFFRSYPDYGEHQAGYCVNAGLDPLLNWMDEVRFGEEEIAYLRDQTEPSGEASFSDEFLDWLEGVGFDSLTVDAVPEGRVVHPNTPITVVRGPLSVAQLLESALLNFLNYSLLVATKAARIKQSGRNNSLLEFGMRRAQGKGANAGGRAALIGGCDFTSNTALSADLGYQPKGTHAHSLVQAFMTRGMSERDAFEAFADVYPDSCILLVDTIDTLNSGVPNAIKVFEKLRDQGHEPVGIRLDSGDLAHLSVRSAEMLDQAGFEDVSIVLSNQLDEAVLDQIIDQIRQEAPQYGLDPKSVVDRLTYGVGTRLITSRGDAALDGVYKLVSLKNGERWEPAIKISETPEKVPNPGRKNLWRLYDQRGRATADCMGMAGEELSGRDSITLRHPIQATLRRTVNGRDVSHQETLLRRVWKGGPVDRPKEPIEAARERRRKDLNKLDPGVRRTMNPHIYHVSLTERLWQKKQQLIENPPGSSS